MLMKQDPKLKVTEEEVEEEAAVVAEAEAAVAVIAVEAANNHRIFGPSKHFN